VTHKFIIGFSIIIVAIVAILPREYLILKEYSHGLFGHGIAFFFLSTMFYFFSGLKVWTQILYLLAIGLVIEIIQHFSDYRIASAEDLLFDIYGISSFYALLVFRPLFLAIKYRLIMSQKK
jgi:VanZ family protein